MVFPAHQIAVWDTPHTQNVYLTATYLWRGIVKDTRLIRRGFATFANSASECTDDRRCRNFLHHLTGWADYIHSMPDIRKSLPGIPSGLLLILVGAVVLRVIYLYCYSSLPDWEQLTVDNYYHHHWAQTIAAGNVVGDTTYFRAPFYVWCLGALYALFGSSLWVARVFGAAAGLATVAVTYFLARRIYDHRAGLVAAALFAVLPTPLYFEAEILLDPLFTLLFICAIYFLVVWLDTGYSRNAVLSGLMIGLATLTRPTALILLFVMAAFLLFSHRTNTRRWHQMALLVAVCAAVVGITFARNLVVAGDPVIIASQGGINLYLGNHEHADGVSAAMPEPYGHNWRIKQITEIAEQEEERTLKPGEVSTFWTRRAVQWASDQPVTFLTLYAKKFALAFCNREVSNNRDLANMFDSIFLLKYNPLPFAVLLGLSVLGIIVTQKSNRHLWVVVLIVVGYAATIALFFFNSRFRLPLMPLFAVLSAGGIIGAVRTVRVDRGKLAVKVTIAAIVMLVVSFWQPVSGSHGRSPHAFVSKGIHYFSVGKYTQALSYFQSAVTIDENFPEANLNAGACHVRLGNLEEAESCFAREIEHNPERPKAYINLASLFLLRGDQEAAMTQLRQALLLAPSDPDANILHLRLAAAIKDDRLDLAEVTQLSATRTKDDIFVLNEAAILLTQSGDMETADRILRRAIASSPPPVETDDALFTRGYRNSESNWSSQTARSHYQLGYVNGIQGRYGEATRHSRLAIDLDSTLADAYVNLINGLVATGSLDQADSVMQDALVRFPGYPSLQRLIHPKDTQ